MAQWKTGKGCCKNIECSWINVTWIHQYFFDRKHVRSVTNWIFSGYLNMQHVYLNTHTNIYCYVVFFFELWMTLRSDSDVFDLQTTKNRPELDRWFTTKTTPRWIRPRMPFFWWKNCLEWIASDFTSESHEDIVWKENRHELRTITYPLQKAGGKMMIFFFPRWGMLVPWRVYVPDCNISPLND